MDKEIVDLRLWYGLGYSQIANRFLYIKKSVNIGPPSRPLEQNPDDVRGDTQKRFGNGSDINKAIQALEEPAFARQTHCTSVQQTGKGLKYGGNF